MSTGKYHTQFYTCCQTAKVICAIFGSLSVVKLDECKQLQKKSSFTGLLRSVMVSCLSESQRTVTFFFLLVIPVGA